MTQIEGMVKIFVSNNDLALTELSVGTSQVTPIQDNQTKGLWRYRSPKSRSFHQSLENHARF